MKARATTKAISTRELVPRQKARGGDETEKKQALLEALFIYLRTLSSHGPSHPQGRKASEALAACVSSFSPCFPTVAFIDGVAFIDRKLVVADLAIYQRSRFIAETLWRAGASEIRFSQVPGEDHLAAFGEGLLARELGDFTSSAISCRQLEQTFSGEEREVVDPETAAATHVALAVLDAEAACVEASPWALALACARRLEVAMLHHRHAAARALEFGGEFNRARRSLSAGRLVQGVLATLGVPPPERRSATHAMILLSLRAFREDPPKPLAAAATEALAIELEHERATSAHRLRTLAHLHALSRGPQMLPTVDLFALIFAIESRRKPEGVAFALTLGDLLAEACTGKLAASIEQGWLRLLVQSEGLMPIGARVRLGDGRIGVVLGPGVGGPLRPEVWLDGQVHAPTSDVRLA